MKKMITGMMLVTGISSHIIAQEKNVFEIPKGAITNRFTLDLGAGNSMQLELSSMDDLSRIQNIDSLIGIFVKDIIPLKDSVTDELSSKRIDHVTDLAGRKKIRLLLSKPAGSSFVLQQGELAELKTAQDTVNLIGMIDAPLKYTLHKPFAEQRYYRISFVLNRLSDLENLQGKNIGDKLAKLQTTKSSRWSRDKAGDWHIIKGDPALSAANPGGHINNSQDYLTSVITMNLQNYKNRFVPSFSLGIEIILNNGRIRRNISYAWEPNFLFAANPGGGLQTFRNDFVTLSYAQERVNPGDDKKMLHFNPSFSLSYLRKSRGGYFDDNSFRLGAGGFNLFKDKIKIEPGIYFTDFFKNVTPGVKLSINF